MMTHRQSIQEPAIEEVRDQFEQWRHTRNKRSKIPDHLWLAAIKMSEIYGLNKTSKMLRLNASDLRKRIEQSKADSLPEPIIQPKFIGLNIGNSEPAEYVIEILHPNGSKMKTQTRGVNIDVIEICKVFLSGGQK